MTHRKPQTALASIVAVVLAAPGCVIVKADFNPFASRPRPLEERVVAGDGDHKILLLDVKNMISDAEEEGALGLTRRPSMVDRIEQQLARAREDDAVKAVIVRINSPGGTVTASDRIYQRLRRFAEERKAPIFAQMMDVAASGGYYVALAADRIVAHPTTVTGSVGVIFYSVNFAGLMTKIGVENQTVKTGARKDVGSPLRAMTPEEKQLVQDLLEEMRERFMDVVRERRPGITPAALATIADGRVLSAGQAKELGLVDDTAYLDDTIEMARARIGAPDARVIVYRRPTDAEEVVYARGTQAQAPTVNLLNLQLGSLLPSPQLLYLWLPQ